MPLLVRVARNRDEDHAFNTSVNVLVMDVIKLGFCAIVLSCQRRSILG